jgi:hypothetical protein
MAAEKAPAEQPDPLSTLGQVSPPTESVLAAARERLWSAITAEMLLVRPAEGGAASARDADLDLGQSRRES